MTTTTLDERRFHEWMESTRISRELLFPAGSSVWRDDRFVLRKEEKAAVRTQISGVRFQAADASREYALQRVAFGRPIAHHQALAFLSADMAAGVDAA